MPNRPALNNVRIVDAAATVADRSGLAGVTMRTVGKELGVEAMSLYHHIANKEALVDELADWVFTRIAVVDIESPWRTAMVERAHSARRVLVDHSWALGLIESRRANGPACLRHHDAVLGCLRHNGFSLNLAATAFSALDAYVYGFALTEVNLPLHPDESTENFISSLGIQFDAYPHLAEMIAAQISGTDYSYGDEFDRGLGIILDGLADRLDSPR